MWNPHSLNVTFAPIIIKKTIVSYPSCNQPNHRSTMGTHLNQDTSSIIEAELQSKLLLDDHHVQKGGLRTMPFIIGTYIICSSLSVSVLVLVLVLVLI
ncbi:hypothetical protein Hanom_Chr01g00090471 [Helianthus anomalus]